MKKNKAYILIIAVVCISILSYALSGINKIELDLKVEDTKVGEEEFFRAMSLKIPEVKSFYSQKMQEELESDFWFNAQDGEDPIETLYDRTIDEVKGFRAIYVLALENGNVDTINFESMEERRQKENERLQEEGQTTIFGTTSYNPDEFEFYEVRKLRQAYIESSDDERFDISDEAINQYFNENKESFVEEGDYKISFIQVENINEDAKKEYQQLVDTLSNGEKIDDIIDEYDNLKDSYQQTAVGKDTISFFKEKYPQVFELNQEINKDVNFATSDNDSELIVVQNDKIYKSDDELLEEKRDEIKLAIQTIEYASLVKEKAQTLEIEENREENIKFTRDILKRALDI